MACRLAAYDRQRLMEMIEHLLFLLFYVAAFALKGKFFSLMFELKFRLFVFQNEV